MRRIRKEMPPAPLKLFLIALLMLSCCLVAGCGDARPTGQQATQSGSPTPSSTNTQPPGSVAAQSTSNAQTASSSSGSAQDESGVLLDYRKGFHQEPLRLDSQTQRRVVQAAYGAQAAPEDYSVNGSARGSFTSAGRRETVYLVQHGGPSAADPNGAQDLTLVVFDESDRAVTRLKTRDFNFIEGTGDVNGDGVQELLLSGSFYNMGTLAGSVRLVELKDQRLKVVKEFEDVYENPCDGDQSAGVTAGVITSRLELSLYRAPCPARGQDQPDARSFVPVQNEKNRP